MFNRIVSLLIVVCLLCSFSIFCFASDYHSSLYSRGDYWLSCINTAAESLSGVEYKDFPVGSVFNWLVHGITGSISAAGRGDICPSSESPDSLHHASYIPVDYYFGADEYGSYDYARCDYCGRMFRVYGSDVEDAYNEYVDGLDDEHGITLDGKEDTDNNKITFSFPATFHDYGNSSEEHWNNYLSEYNVGTNSFSGTFKSQCNYMYGYWETVRFTADSGGYDFYAPTYEVEDKCWYSVQLFRINSSGNTEQIVRWNDSEIKNRGGHLSISIDQGCTYYIRMEFRLYYSSDKTAELRVTNSQIVGDKGYSCYLPVQSSIPWTPHIDPSGGTYTSIEDNSVTNITNINFDPHTRTYDFDTDTDHHFQITYDDDHIKVVDTDNTTGTDDTQYYYYTIDPFTGTDSVIPVEDVPDYISWLERFKKELFFRLDSMSSNSAILSAINQFMAGVFTRLDSIISSIQNISIDVTSNDYTVTNYHFSTGPSLVYIPIEPTLSINPEIGLDGVLELFPDAEVNVLPINGDIDLSAALELSLGITSGDIISQETNQDNSVTYHTNDGDYTVTDNGPYITVDDGDTVYYVWRDEGEDVPWLRAWLEGFKTWLGDKLDNLGFDITENYTDADTHGTKTLFQWLLELIKTLIEGIVQGLADGISYVISHVIYAITDTFLQSIKFLHGIVDLDDAGDALKDFFSFFGSGDDTSGSGFDWASEFAGVDDF